MIANPKRLILIGFILLLIGAVLPFLMILNVVETSFLLSFISHGAQISGLFLGTLGAFSYARTDRR